MAPPVSLPCKRVTSAQISVGHSFECAVAQETARQIANKLGFAAVAGEEIVRVVTELALHMARHMGCGVLTLRLLDDGARVGIEVEAEEHDPGIRNPERLFREGNSSGAVLDSGLGDMQGLMDEREISSTAGLGMRIVCRRWLRPQADPVVVTPATAQSAIVQSPIVERWQVGVATRPRHLAAANGDAFVICECEGRLLAGVIDGLGHGEPAERAALAAQAYVQSHYDLPLDQLFRGVNSACHGTRGVVMALARFESPTVMMSANLGNVEMRAWSGTKRFDVAVQRGFLGVQEEQVQVQRHHWEPNWMLVLHSDGVRGQWQWSDFPGLEQGTPQAVANQFLRTLAKPDDDATVLVVKSGRGDL
jgi:anti-sigma regulatory factor (Ser/Thr protein kinase)